VAGFWQSLHRSQARTLESESSRAARIEPVTPPDAVYVTEAFAAEPS
jgi:hypothetical protein